MQQYIHICLYIIITPPTPIITTPNKIFWTKFHHKRQFKMRFLEMDCPYTTSGHTIKSVPSPSAALRLYVVLSGGCSMVTPRLKVKWEPGSWTNPSMSIMDWHSVLGENEYVICSSDLFAYVIYFHVVALKAEEFMNCYLVMVLIFFQYSLPKHNGEPRDPRHIMSNDS